MYIVNILVIKENQPKTSHNFFAKQHDGLEKTDSWFLEDIEVVNLATKTTYLFHCGQWLSLFENDCQLRRVLKALDPKKHGKTGKQEGDLKALDMFGYCQSILTWC